MSILSAFLFALVLISVVAVTVGVLIVFMSLSDRVIGKDWVGGIVFLVLLSTGLVYFIGNVP